MSALMKEPEDEEDPDFLQETTRRTTEKATMRVRAIMCFMLQIENVK